MITLCSPSIPKCHDAAGRAVERLLSDRELDATRREASRLRPAGYLGIAKSIFAGSLQPTHRDIGHVGDVQKPDQITFGNGQHWETKVRVLIKHNACKAGRGIFFGIEIVNGLQQLVLG